MIDTAYRSLAEIFPSDKAYLDFMAKAFAQCVFLHDLLGKEFLTKIQRLYRYWGMELTLSSYEEDFFRSLVEKD